MKCPPADTRNGKPGHGTRSRDEFGMSDERPDPDDLLRRVQVREAKDRRGKLKIFLGAAPGVGKTYAMLTAARQKVKEGVDLVIGWVQPHVRPETQALVLGLE